MRKRRNLDRMLNQVASRVSMVIIGAMVLGAIVVGAILAGR